MTTLDNSERLLGLLSQPYDIGPIGNIRQIGQVQSPARSNLSWLGLTAVTGALNGSEVATVVAIPVMVGDIITKVKLALGAVSGVKVEAGFAAIYPGTKEGVLLGQSKSAKLTATKETALEFTLETPIEITEAMAPHGYVYVAIAMEAETMPTCTGVAVTAGSQAALTALSPNAPLYLAAKAGSGLKTTAKEKIESPAVVAQVPIVILH